MYVRTSVKRQSCTLLQYLILSTGNYAISHTAENVKQYDGPVRLQ
jgi:hypothetical protein